MFQGARRSFRNDTLINVLSAFPRARLGVQTPTAFAESPALLSNYTHFLLLETPQLDRRVNCPRAGTCPRAREAPGDVNLCLSENSCVAQKWSGDRKEKRNGFLGKGRNSTPGGAVYRGFQGPQSRRRGGRGTGLTGVGKDLGEIQLGAAENTAEVQRGNRPSGR